MSALPSHIPPQQRTCLHPAHRLLLVHQAIIARQACAVIEEAKEAKAVVDRDNLRGAERVGYKVQS